MKLRPQEQVQNVVQKDTEWLVWLGEEMLQKLNSK